MTQTLIGVTSKDALLELNNRLNQSLKERKEIIFSNRSLGSLFVVVSLKLNNNKLNKRTTVFWA